MDEKNTVWEKIDRNPLHHEEDVFDEEFGTPGNSANAKMAIMCAILVITLITFVTVVNMCIVKVDATDFVISQSPMGRFEVLDRPGYHFRGLAKTWTFKRYSNIKMDDNCMFKDGRPRKIDTYIRVQLPETTEARMELHRRFNGQMHNIEKMVDMAVTMALRDSTAKMDSHYFDVEGLPEIVRMVQRELIKDLPQYGLTLSGFGIYNATLPANEVPQGEQASPDGEK